VIIIGGDVRVLWSATSNDYGSAVVDYKILFKDDTVNYIESPFCLGTDSAVIANKSCSVGMDNFTDPSGLY
jgi:hypothetical protein